MENDINAIFFHTMDSGKLELAGYPCVITYAKTPYLQNSIAFTFQKNSPYRKLFSYFLFEMKQSGQIERLYRKHSMKIMTMKSEHKECMVEHKFFQSCRPNEADCVPAVGLKTIITAVVMVASGVLLGVIVLIIEWMDYHGHFKFCKKLQNNKPLNYFQKKRGFLVIFFLVFIISLIIVSALLAFHISASKKNLHPYREKDFYKTNEE